MTILHVLSVAGQEEGEGSLLAWAERSGRRPAAEPGRGGLRFVFYGRVPTEDHQDPVTSRARQRDQAGALVAGHGQIVAELFDIGQSRTLAWARRTGTGSPTPALIRTEPVPRGGGAHTGWSPTRKRRRRWRGSVTAGRAGRMPDPLGRLPGLMCF